MSTQEKPEVIPLEDLKKASLALYEQGANAIHHWSSFIVKCIEEYQPVEQEEISPADKDIKNKPYNEINEIHLPLGKAHRLVRWANTISGYYGFPVYLVGSALIKTMPRDIDVCCIIPDDLFCKRYHIEDIQQHVSKKISGMWEDEHWRWSDDVVKRTYLGWDYTHMNIDFKAISETESRAQGYEDKPRLQLSTNTIQVAVASTDMVCDVCGKSEATMVHTRGGCFCRAHS